MRDRSELLGKTDLLDKMNFVPQFVSVGDVRAKPLPCRFGACIHIAMACRSQELCFQRVDLWNHPCHLTTFASQVAGCLSTMCAYNLVNGDMAKTDCQMPPLKSFLFGVGAGGFYKLYSKCVVRQEMTETSKNIRIIKEHATCRRLIETMPSQEFMPVQMKRLDSNMMLLSAWEERLFNCFAWMSKISSFLSPIWCSVG